MNEILAQANIKCGVFMLGPRVRATLNDEDKRALTLGGNFTPLPKELEEKEVKLALDEYERIIACEYFFHTNPDIEAERAEYIKKLHISSGWKPEQGLPSNISNYLDNLKRTLLNYTSARTKAYRYPPKARYNKLLLKKTIKKLEINNLCLTNADKNLGTVICVKHDYHNAIFKHLNDANTFRLITKERADWLMIEAHNNIYNLAHEYLNDKNANDRRDMDFLIEKADTCNSGHPRPYILWKIHKVPNKYINKLTSNIPTRLIIPACKSILRGASIYVDNYLAPLIKNINTITCGSLSFMTDLEHIRFNNDISLTTLDVINMYPNMEHEYSCSAVREYLTYINVYSSNKNDLIVELIKVILSHATCCLNNLYYLQIKGATIGTNAAVVIANLYMYKLEINIVNTMINEGIILYYKRFLDDIFIIFSNNNVNLPNNFLNLFNRQGKLQLALTEAGSQVSFLDMQVIKTDTCLKFKIFNKSQNLYAYTSNMSFISAHSKQGFIKGELIRAIRFHSDESDFARYRENVLRPALLARGYSNAQLNKCWEDLSHDMRPALLQPRNRHRQAPGPILKLRCSPAMLRNNFDAAVKQNWMEMIHQRTDTATLFGNRTMPIVAKTKNPNVNAIANFLKK